MSLKKKKILITITGLVALVFLGIYFFYSKNSLARGCEKRADEVAIVTARVDKRQASEEAYFHCLIKAGTDPYRYKYKKRDPSKETSAYISSLKAYYKNLDKNNK